MIVNIEKSSFSGVMLSAPMQDNNLRGLCPLTVTEEQTAKLKY